MFAKLALSPARAPARMPAVLLLLLAALLSAVLPAFPAGAALAQTYPNDDAKLYEAAKKEGTLVWYESGPLEPMKEVAAEFEKKYPGIKVEVLRIVGVQQYQRIIDRKAQLGVTLHAEPVFLGFSTHPLEG